MRRDTSVWIALSALLMVDEGDNDKYFISLFDYTSYEDMVKPLEHIPGDSIDPYGWW